MLTLRNSYAGTSYCMTLSGRLGAESLGSFVAEVVRMEESGAEETAVDLSRLDFIDSSGMAALADAGERFRADGRRLRLLGHPKQFAHRPTGHERGEGR